MPAINLARLRKQTAVLVDHFNQPEAFLRLLHDLLDHYADHILRHGQAGEPPPLIQAYRVPAPMLRQLAQELAPRASEDAPLTLALCDALWTQPYLEPRILATTLIGQAPLTSVDDVLSRVEKWAESTSEERLIEALANRGLMRVQQEQPERLLLQIEDWLGTESLMLRRIGLRALISLISDASFENLPVALKLVTPYVRVAPLPLKPDILDVLAALARRSAKETAYFLRQNLDVSGDTDTAWLIRQSLRFFPVETQDSLRDAIRRT